SHSGHAGAFWDDQRPPGRRRLARLGQSIRPCAGAGHLRDLGGGKMSIIGVLIIGLLVGLVARFITPGPNPSGIIVTIVIGIVGAVIATYGGQALGLYQVGQPAGFIGSVLGAVVLLVLLRLFNR